MFVILLRRGIPLAILSTYTTEGFPNGQF